MNQLITRAIEDNNLGVLAEFPPDLMSEEEQKIVTFVLEFNRKFDAPPSLKRLMKDFELFIPYKFSASSWEKTPPPLGDIFVETINKKLLNFTERKMREADLEMRRSGLVPIETFYEIERVHALTMGVMSYSTFDREGYFRRSSTDLPFRIINKHIGGLGNGDFMLVAGRLGTGKSTIVQYITKHIWETGKKVLFVSAEMLPLDVFSRIDAMVGGFNPLELRKGKTKSILGTLKSVQDTVSLKKGGEIIIPRARLLSPEQIATLAKNLAVDLIIVDGAYLLKPNDGGWKSKWEKVATVSNELKQMALDLDLPLLATVQIKRGASGADGYTPEDIALSDALGQDADFVVAVHQDRVVANRLELQLIKNRYGSLCATQIYLDFDTMSVVDETVTGRVSTAKLDPEIEEDWFE